MLRFDLPLYECENCGHVTRDPEKDAKDLTKAGYRTCCPERKLRLARALPVPPPAQEVDQK